MKYVFKQIDDYTPSETTVEFQADSLYTILEQFQHFLKGSGFSFVGNLDFVLTQDPNIQDWDYADSNYGYESYDEEGEIEHSQHYFDKDRNR